STLSLVEPTSVKGLTYVTIRCCLWLHWLPWVAPSHNQPVTIRPPSMWLAWPKKKSLNASCNFSPRSDLVRTAQNLALTISRIEVILDVCCLPIVIVFDCRQVRCRMNGVAAGFSLSLIMMEQYQCRLAQYGDDLQVDDGYDNHRNTCNGPC